MDLETQAELIVISFVLLYALFSYIIYTHWDNRTVRIIVFISLSIMLLFSVVLASVVPDIELQDTFNTTISDKYIEDSNSPFSEKQFYVLEFQLEHFKKEYINESVYNSYEIGDNYTHVVVYEQW